MLKRVFIGGLSAALLASASVVLAADATEEGLAACYKQAQNSPERLTGCLEKELDYVKKEHKDVVERIYLLAKGMDTKKGVRGTTDQILKTNSAFLDYVERECAVMQRMNDGDAVDKKNDALSCEVNLYRMRVDMLENRYLSAAK